jgi:hypothetical protein
MTNMAKQHEEQMVTDWNAKHGDASTPVWYWKGDRSGPGLAGWTSGPAYLLGGAAAAVRIVSGPVIALTHIDVVEFSDLRRHEAVEQEQEHQQDIDTARREFTESIAAALTAVRDAGSALFDLTGPLYDVDYAEGGQKARDIEHFLADATRALRVVEAFNTTIQA